MSQSNDHEPDASDLRLLNALQVEPRASWRAISPLLGLDPATLSRRWQRLEDAGIAWTTGVLGRELLYGSAFIEVECAPDALRLVADTLAADPEVSVLEFTAGGRDLLVTLTISDQQVLWNYVTDRFAQLPGVRVVRTHVIIDGIVEGGAWRLRELTTAETAGIPLPSRPRARAPRTVAAELQQILALELARDGRASASAIGAAHGVAPQRISDAIATLRASGELRFRTDVSRSISRWPTSVWYFIEVPATVIESLRVALPKIPEIRLAALCGSRYNLLLAVWLRNLRDIHRFEASLERAVPGLRIADRSIVTRLAKHVGRHLDENGRVIRHIGGKSKSIGLHEFGPKHCCETRTSGGCPKFRGTSVGAR